MPLTELLMNCLAGLGLLFVGIKMVTRNLGAVAGDHLRQRIAWAGSNRFFAVIAGVVGGFVAQSGRTTSFIMASLVHAGILDTRRAIPVVLWSNFGCTLVIFAAIFPLHLFALFMLAVAGVCVAFERPKPLLNAATATFGLALMLYGLKMTSSTAGLLTDLQGFSQVLDLIRQSLALSFLCGLVLTLVAQSHMAIMLIAVALASRGVFGFEQTVMLIFGTHAGSAVITLLTGIHFGGEPRQVVVGQILYNVAGIAVFMPLFLIAHYALGGLALPALVDASHQAALAAVVFNFATPLGLTLLRGPFEALCRRLAPLRSEDELGKPEYLSSDPGESASVTLVLAEKEQSRLLGRLPLFCEWSRAESDPPEGAAVDRFAEAFRSVSRAIERAQGALMSREMSAEDTEWLLNQQKRQQLLLALMDACHEMHAIVRGAGPGIAPLRTSTIEALDTLLLTLVDAVNQRDREELDDVQKMTAHNAPTMERLRKRYLAMSGDLSEQERSQILQITSTFERAAWTVRNYAALLSDASWLFDQAPVAHTAFAPSVMVPATGFEPVAP